MSEPSQPVEEPARGSASPRPSSRGRRVVLGLRPRVFAALLLTSAVTLAVAALALLSPLEQRLRSDGERAVFTAIAASRPQLSEIALDRATKRPNRGELAATVALLRHRAGAQVTLLDRRLDTVYAPVNQDLDVPSYFTQARRAFRTNRGVHTLVGDELVVAEPVRVGESGPTYAVVLVRRLQYVSSAVNVVRSAFVKAAAVGFGIALLLGIALTTTLLRRLERLREAAGELERRGLDAPLHVEDSHDEIGDLTRAFASMQERLRRQEQARRAFVATASHELRTPLASLDGTLELLEDDLRPDRIDIEDARDRTARAREQSRRLSSLATDLLDLSRLDAEAPMRAEPVELSELSRAVAAEFERRAGEREVRIDIRPTHDACWAQGDPGAVARIVRILLDNAIGVSPGGMTVRLSTTTSEDHTEISVSDSGPGVPEGERERIFERFQRGAASRGRSGFGLGLAIGHELAQRMGGSLRLQEPVEDSETLGACFTLRLPVAQLGDDGAR